MGTESVVIHKLFGHLQCKFRVEAAAFIDPCKLTKFKLRLVGEVLAFELNIRAVCTCCVWPCCVSGGLRRSLRRRWC